MDGGCRDGSGPWGNGWMGRWIDGLMRATGMDQGHEGIDGWGLGGRIVGSYGDGRMETGGISGWRDEGYGMPGEEGCDWMLGAANSQAEGADKDGDVVKGVHG